MEKSVDTGTPAARLSFATTSGSVCKVLVLPERFVKRVLYSLLSELREYCRRYLFAKVAEEKKRPRLQPFWRMRSIPAVCARVPAPPWQKDISGSLGAYWRQFFNRHRVFLNPNLDTYILILTKKCALRQKLVR
ncbi:hypothetical protein JW933_07070 [candidate division FCPU426 bacterium]|nr:hypothetical protein [candidate division FCPU426 bacterium]